jgi:hypothetical protein
MTLNCIDVSNYSGALDDAQVAGLRAVGVELGIVQSLEPPAGYPQGVTRQQIQALLDGGIAVDAYVWLWFAFDVDDIERKCALLDGLPIRQMWLDVEDQAAVQYDQATIEQKIQAAMDRCDQVPVTGGRKTGVYSGRWWWADKRYGNDTTAFSDRVLWDSDYDGLDTTGGFVPYGGWRERTIKQYHGTTTLAGVPNVDLNVLSDDELARVQGGGDMADCQAYKDALARVVNRIQIEDERKTANGQPATLRRTIVREIASEAFQALQS